MGTRAPKDAFRSRLFFHRGVGSSILASLSEAGGNDRHKSRSKPLPPRSEIHADRHSECVHFNTLCSLVTIPNQRSGIQDSLIFVAFPMSRVARFGVRGRLPILIRERGIPPRESKPVAAARHEPRLQHVTDLRATSCDCRRQIIPLRPWQLRTVNIRKHFDTFPERNHRKPAISLDALECGSTNSSRSSLMPSGYRDCCRAQALGLKLSERLLEKSRPLIELDPGAASGISQDGVTASRIHVF